MILWFRGSRYINPEKFGHINIVNVDYTSAYGVKGFDRMWSFERNEDNSSFLYTFLIEPNGDAMYYDFRATDKAAPSMYMKCRLKEQLS